MTNEITDAAWNAAMGNPEDNVHLEPEANLDPAAADAEHVQGVLDRHAAGTLVTVLACDEDVDGAYWDVLIRDLEGNLVRADVEDGPGYSHVDVRASY
jgi:hypothetical protein